ncbi:AAA domain-containing protein [Rahnella aquatilis]|uniref:AAA domain-containing protein n=1 Tax=Rahnella aquatilis TaxID=34038 RepID=UPI003649D0BE
MEDTSLKVLKAWQEYIKYSGMEKSKIPADNLHEYQQIYLTDRNVRDDDDGIRITLSSNTLELLKQKYIKYDKKGKVESTTPVHFLFPIIRYSEFSNNKKTTKYLPLFSFQLNPELFIQEGQQTVLIPVKDGTRVSPLLSAFKELLGFDISELGENRHMMSLISALNEQKYNSFLEAFAGLKMWIEEKLVGTKWRNARLETGFNALICELHNEDFNTQRDGKDFTCLTSRNDLSAFPLLQQYLCQQDEPLNNEEINKVVTLGLFEKKYPLGRGQMQALQSVQKNLPLVAVQGAPGTGKTTLFKSLIAQKVVERALAIIDGNDRNLGMLITSTAIKAVENVIDDLRDDDVVKGLDWLYFQAGSKEKVQSEVMRIDKLLKTYEQQSADARARGSAEQRLCQNREMINHCYTHYHTRKNALQQAISACGDPTTRLHDLDAILKSEQDAFALQAESVGIPVTSFNAVHLTAVARFLHDEQKNHAQKLEAWEQANIRARYWLSVWPVSFDLTALTRFMQGTLPDLLEDIYGDYPRSGIAAFLTRFFSGKRNARREKAQAMNLTEFTALGLNDLSHQQMADLLHYSRELRNKKEDLAHLQILQGPEPEADRIPKLKSLHEQLGRLQALERHILETKERARAFAQNYPEGDWPDILRLRFIRQHRAMFEDAVAFLWQEQLTRKTELTEILTVWRDLLTRTRSPHYFTYRNARQEEFYRLLSLAYPVIATTLASAYKPAGYENLGDFEKVKPYHLTLCDEAGMVSVETLVPLLSRSEQAIIVGDPAQIEPIRTLSEGVQNQLREQHFGDDDLLYDRMSPMLVTAYHRAAGTSSGSVNDIGNGIVLDEHRRCQPPIAALFTQLAGYEGISVETAPPSEAVASAFAAMDSHHLMFYSVEGKKGPGANTNLDEVEAIDDLLTKLESAGYDLTKDVGIITPYANQKNLLIQKMGNRLGHYDSLRIGSVHQFQGTGFEVIIYSPVIHSPRDNDKFQNNKPNLLNVAVSRAKQQFIVVGNYDRLIVAGRYLKTLAEVCANDFILELGSQHPKFSELSQSPAVETYYRDCEHIDAFHAATQQCQQELIVVSPWLRFNREGENPQLSLLIAARQRGIDVKVYYGYDHAKYGFERDGDPLLIEQYIQSLGRENVIRINEGTHEKLLLVDNHYALVGSWNWLSHGYHQICRLQGNLSQNIRREVSVKLRDPAFVLAQKDSLL